MAQPSMFNANVVLVEPLFHEVLPGRDCCFGNVHKQLWSLTALSLAAVFVVLGQPKHGEEQVAWWAPACFSAHSSSVSISIQRSASRLPLLSRWVKQFRQPGMSNYLLPLPSSFQRFSSAEAIFSPTRETPLADDDWYDAEQPREEADTANTEASPLIGEGDDVGDYFETDYSESEIESDAEATDDAQHDSKESEAEKTIWSIRPALFRKYMTAFEAFDFSDAQYVTEPEAMKFLERSNLTTAELVSIWRLSDIDCDCRLNNVELACAMHLASLRRQGFIAELPLTLPSELMASLTALHGKQPVPPTLPLAAAKPWICNLGEIPEQEDAIQAAWKLRDREGEDTEHELWLASLMAHRARQEYVRQTFIDARWMRQPEINDAFFVGGGPSQIKKVVKHIVYRFHHNQSIDLLVTGGVGPAYTAVLGVITAQDRLGLSFDGKMLAIAPELVQWEKGAAGRPTKPTRGGLLLRVFECTEPRFADKRNSKSLSKKTVIENLARSFRDFLGSRYEVMTMESVGTRATSFGLKAAAMAQLFLEKDSKANCTEEGLPLPTGQKYSDTVVVVPKWTGKKQYVVKLAFLRVSKSEIPSHDNGGSMELFDWD